MSNHFKTIALLATLSIGQNALAQFQNNALIPDKNALSYDHVPDKVFVRFLDADNRSNHQSILDEVGGTILSESKLVPGLFAIEIDVSVERALNILSTKRSSIKYVEPIYIVEAFDTIPNDPMYGDLYGMDQINAPQAWDDHVGDQEFIIAVIDTGVDYNHQDLAANMWTNPGEIPGNGQDDDGNGYIDDVHGYDFSNYDSDPMDGNGHGTHCSGTIGGVGNNGIGVAGVNWRCRIVGAQFLSAGGSGSIQGAIDAVEYCAINEFQVSNNSWGGGGFSQALWDVIQTAGDQYGHIFVAAAGNGGSYGASYPGALSCSNIICVAATDVNENMASFSQYHPTEVDLGAPGVDVLSSTPGNNYSYYSGTSMATPHVAGGVGLIYSVMGGTSSEKVIDVILSSTRPISSMQGNCATGGVLNVADALANTFLGPQITMLSEVPADSDPNVPIQVSVNIDPREDTLLDGSVYLHYRSNNLANWTVQEMDNDGLMLWNGTVAGMACEDDPEFYISCQGQVSGTVEHPSGGEANAYGWMIGTSIVSYDDNGESDGDWTVSSSALDGQWNRGVPINCDRGDPSSDYDGSGSCWLTDNSSGDGCNSDVDEGYTTLTSGVIDLSQVNSPILSYARWFHNSSGAAPNTDTFVVEWSSNGSAWYELESVGPSGSEVNGGWVHVSFSVNDFAGDITQVQLRFTASDEGADTQSVVEAGVDAIMVSAVDCDDVNPCPADANGDGVVNVNDLLGAIGDWGLSDSPADVNGDGTVNITDLLAMIGAWGACP
jgi:subtilisin family serine protease